MTNFFHCDDKQQLALGEEKRQRFLEVAKGMAAAAIEPIIDGLVEPYDDTSKEVKRLWDDLPTRERRQIA